MAAALKGERGLLGDPECLSAGKNIKAKWDRLSALSRIHVFASYNFNKLDPQNVYQRSGSGTRSAIWAAL